MKEVKSSQSNDRLRQLPESLIFHIFWFLPMRDVVRTTILSKQWNKLWTTTPCLNLSYSDIGDDLDAIQKFIYMILVYWEGTNIDKLKIGLDFLYRGGRKSCSKLFNDLDCWVHFALRKRVQELYLEFNEEFKDYSVPHKLYSCSWLKVLSLTGFSTIGIDGNVRWNQLKSLTIHCKHISASAILQVLRSNPQLEVLILSFIIEENWTILSSSLKRLSIDNKPSFIKCDACKEFELKIDTPNLETLEISGIRFNKYLLMDVSSLTNARLGFNYWYFCDYHIEYEFMWIGEALRQILPAIQQVEKLRLGETSIQVLGNMVNNKKDFPSSLSNVEFLKLENDLPDYKEIVGVLKIFPKVKILALKGGENYCEPRNKYEEEKEEKQLLEFDTTIPASLLQHLRTIYITCEYDGLLMLPLIKIVLKYGSKLEKMVIRGEPPPDPLQLSKKLLRMPRSSPKAELVFFKD